MNLEEILAQSKIAKLKGKADREKEILKLLAEGYTSEKVGKMVNLSPKTIDAKVYEYGVLLKARNRTHLITLLFRNKIIE